MPAFVESQMSDKDAADLTAYFASLPKVDAPGKWRFEVRGRRSERAGDRAQHRLRPVSRP